MEYPLDTPGAPGGTGTEPGQEDSTGQETQTQQVPVTADPVAEQLQELERHNKELQDRLTRQGRDLARLKQQGEQVQTQPPQESKTFFDDPDAALSAFEQRLMGRIAQERQTEQTLRNFAEEHDIPVRRLQALNDRVTSAMSNPDDYLEMLAQVHAAENAATQVQRAVTTATDTVKQEARAVTAEGGQPSPGEPGEIPIEEFRKWPKEKRAEYLARRFGMQDL